MRQDTPETKAKRIAAGKRSADLRRAARELRHLEAYFYWKKHKRPLVA